MNSAELYIINMVTGLVWLSIPLAMLVYALRKKEPVFEGAASAEQGLVRRFNWWDILICLGLLLYLEMLPLIMANTDPSFNPMIYAGEKGGVEVRTTVLVLVIAAAFQWILIVPTVLRLCRSRARKGAGWSFAKGQWIKKAVLLAFAMLAAIFVLDWVTGFAKFCEKTFNSATDMLPLVKGLLQLSWQWSGMMFLAIVVLAPVFEELLFRAYLYPMLKERTGTAFAVVMTTLIFSLVHMNLAGSFSYIILGLGLIWIYEKSHSIWAPIMLHGIYNALVFGLTFGEALFFSK